MQQVYADLHIHIGSAGGKPVKITASRQLDLKTILYRDAREKGLDMVGIIDAACTNVLLEIETMLKEGELQELFGGGFLARNGVVLIAGAEIESQEGFHSLILVPGLDQLKMIHKYLKTRVRNMTLSTQKARVDIGDLINLTQLTEGIFCPAHAFTPFKGIYGSWADKLAPLIGTDLEQIFVLELGLSADTSMADTLQETRSFTYLSNSDAHSAANIAREYNLLRMGDKTFTELKWALKNQNGRKVIANYGMDPLLGKYYRSFCNDCLLIAREHPPVKICSACGNKNMVKGVMDRIVEIRDYEEPHHPVGRPPYHYRVPLKDLPGVGPKTLLKLKKHFVSEIEILEKANLQVIAGIAGTSVAGQIEKMRGGRLRIEPGGGGYYGKVARDHIDS